jgi:hypothetical protein
VEKPAQQDFRQRFEHQRRRRCQQVGQVNHRAVVPEVDATAQAGERPILHKEVWSGSLQAQSVENAGKQSVKAEGGFQRQGELLRLIVQD